MFEFNADSAGCIFEAGILTDKWANSVGCNYGRSSGAQLEPLLIDQAKELYDGFIHVMIDTDPEELFNGSYMQEVFIKAGFGCKIIIGLNFKKSEEGKFIDEDGIEIKNVWKMWNWETIISDYEKPRKENEVKISDIMLNPQILVYEPIWKLVTSNKGLLPILWELWQGHPYLLRTEWNLDGYFNDKPYARKPIVGRCGENVEIYSKSREVLDEREGNYKNRVFIYQEVFEVQKFDQIYTPVLGVFVIGRKPGGFIIRETEKLITDHESAQRCCRILE